MIEDPPLLKIKRKFPRPDPDLVAKLAGVATGHVVDCQDGSGAMDYQIKPIGRTPSAFCGVAVTCDTGPADNLAVFAALDISRAGDVIVIATDNYRSTAVIGDMVMGMAKNRGVLAVVTDGMVRDMTGLEGVGLPCFAAGVTPNSPARNGPGTAGLPVIAGGVSVSAGDVVVGDQDGVVVVPGHMAADIAARLDEVRTAEADLDAKVMAGLEIPDFVKDLLESDRVVEVE